MCIFQRRRQIQERDVYVKFKEPYTYGQYVCSCYLLLYPRYRNGGNGQEVVGEVTGRGEKMQGVEVLSELDIRLVVDH